MEIKDEVILFFVFILFCVGFGFRVMRGVVILEKYIVFFGGGLFFGWFLMIIVFFERI